MLKGRVVQAGLDETTAVGRVGAYRAGVWTECVQVGTVIAHGHEFFRHGDPTSDLLSVPVGPNYSRRILSNSWTGRSLRYTGDHGTVDVHLRATLPGPLFADFGRTLALRWSFGAAPDHVEDIVAGRRFREFALDDLGQVLLLTGPRPPMLLVASRPIRQYRVISHEHLWLTFDGAGAYVLWVPLLDEADIPRDREKLDLWLRLAAAPPVACEEHYEIAGDTVRIRERFTSLDDRAPQVAPLPPIPALVGDRGRIQSLPAGTMLCKCLLGPYAVVDGDSFDWTIDTTWMRGRVAATRKIEGKLAENLSPVPQELVYAGDVSWEPDSPMDRLLSLRVYAQLAGAMPPALWARIKPMVTPPTPAAFRESLLVLDEPFTGRRWAKDKSIFAERNEVSFDSDWYNGLTLSGMWRGINCADEDIAQASRRLAAVVKQQREWMAEYMWIFHDWGLASSWTDPRGELVDFDCSHNGLEGLLAEMNMRRLDGNAAGADRMQYLAAKMSLIFLANFYLPDWARPVGYVRSDEGGQHLGVCALYERRGVVVQSAATRAPYPLAGNWPEFSWLLRRHGPMDQIRQMADTWKHRHPERYADWDFFSTRGRHDAAASWRQGHRTQNGVFYHVAPEICTRLWVLDEDPDEVEGMYKTPVSLAEQLWCRSAAKATGPAEVLKQ
jgi:hypothetical protein